MKYYKNTNIKFILNELIRTRDENIRLKQKIYNIKKSFPWKCYKLTKDIRYNMTESLKNTIPLIYRKKIKNFLSKILILYKKNQISYALKKEWKSFIKKQPKYIKHDLLIFGLISWDFRFQRPQQLATELSKLGHRVFFIEHEFIPQRLSHSGFQAIEADKINNNLYKIKISSGSKHFIYQDKCSSKDVQIMLGSIKTLIKDARIINPLAIIEHPFWTDLAKKLSMPLVYDCMDNHSGFSETSKENILKEKELVKITKLNIASSQYIYNHLENISKNKNILINNGVNTVDFQKNISDVPSDISQYNQSIIGYYGAISNWFDTTLLEKIAQSYPSNPVILIGEVINDKVIKLAQKYQNIKLLGEKKYSDIPKYLNMFQVALIPFEINPLTRATNPVKVYEYFSQGKAVVSTPLPELTKYKSLLYYSVSHEEFIKNIGKALKENNNKKQLRKKVAKENQWSQKAKEISIKFDRLFPKVSIVILTYNGPQMSKDSIDTVLNRSFYPNKEVIVVDNASNSETVKILKRYQDNPEVKLTLNKVNYGFAKGNNIGTHQARGDYIILLNNDILATPGWIERLVFHAQNHPKVGLVGPVTNSIGNESKIEIEYDHTNWREMEKEIFKYTSKHWGETLPLRNIAAFCWLLSKDVYQKIGDLDERFGRGMFEDDDYCYRVKKAGYQILCAEDAFIHHFGGASFNKIFTDEYKKLFEDNKLKFEKKWHTTWIPHQYRKGVR